jgi:hypothetical protein
VRTLAGRIRADFRLSSDLVYNSFPWPEADKVRRLAVSKAAQAVLDARNAHPTATLAELYDPLATPSNLVRAHVDLDRVVDKLFGSKRFETDAERLAVLFANYQALVEPLATMASNGPTAARRKRAASRRTAGS